MAIKGTILFKDNAGNELEGPRSDKSCTVLEFSIQLKLPYEKTSGQVTGSRMYEPFTVLKEIDKITPFMYQYCAQGGVFKSVVISLYEIAEATGKESVYFTYTLTNARLVSVENYMPSAFEADRMSVAHLEKIALFPESIDWEHKKGATMFTDQGFFSFRIPG